MVTKATLLGLAGIITGSFFAPKTLFQSLFGMVITGPVDVRSVILLLFGLVVFFTGVFIALLVSLHGYRTPSDEDVDNLMRDRR